MRKVQAYLLSTCAWCKKTRRFLDTNNVDYEYQYVDLLSGGDRDRVMSEVAQWNPRRSFPTVVVTNDVTEVVIGFNEQRLREVLGL
jgi:glutaredoxin-like protein NrdH